MSVTEAVTAATTTVAASEVTPKKMRTSTVYKNEIVILSEVAASPCEAAAQSKDPYPRKKLSPWKLPSQVSNCGKIEIPRLHPPIRNANGRITLRMTLNLSGGQKTTPAVFRPETPAP